MSTVCGFESKSVFMILTLLCVLIIYSIKPVRLNQNRDDFVHMK